MQIALCQVAKVISADEGSLQGLAEAFTTMDPQHTGKVSYEAMRELLASGKYDLSEVEVRRRVSGLWQPRWHQDSMLIFDHSWL